jgi:hypothetical protein
MHLGALDHMVNREIGAQRWLMGWPVLGYFRIQLTQTKFSLPFPGIVLMICRPNFWPVTRPMHMQLRN